MGILTLAGSLFLALVVSPIKPAPMTVAAIACQSDLVLALALKERPRSGVLAAGILAYGLIFIFPVTQLDFRGLLFKSRSGALPPGDVVYDATNFSFYERALPDFRNLSRYAYWFGLAPTGMQEGISYRFVDDVTDSGSVLDSLITEKLKRSSWEEKIKILRAFGVTKVLSNGAIEAKGIAPPKADSLTRVYSVEYPLPEAYVVYHSARLANPQRGADTLASDGFDPGTSVILAGIDGEEGVPRPYIPVRLSCSRPDRIEAQLDLDAPGCLVLQRTYFPAFRYTSNRGRIRALPANVSLTAIPLAAGRHSIEGGIPKRGFILSVVLSFLVLVIMFYRAARSPRQ
jgi:hypothetical protein